MSFSSRRNNLTFIGAAYIMRFGNGNRLLAKVIFVPFRIPPLNRRLLGGHLSDIRWENSGLKWGKCEEREESFLSADRHMKNHEKFKLTRNNTDNGGIIPSFGFSILSIRRNKDKYRYRYIPAGLWPVPLSALRLGHDFLGMEEGNLKFHHRTESHKCVTAECIRIYTFRMP